MITFLFDQWNLFLFFPTKEDVILWEKSKAEKKMLQKVDWNNTIEAK